MTRQKEKHTRLVDQTNKSISCLEQLLCMKDAETGIWAYMMMRDTLFLKPFYDRRHCVDSTLTMFRRLTGNDPVQQRYLNELLLKVDGEYKCIQPLTKEMKQNLFFNKDTIIRRSYLSKQFMDIIRDIVLKMQDHENSILLASTEEFNITYRTLKTINIAIMIVAILLTFYAVSTYNTENNAKRLYRAKLEEGLETLKKKNKELVDLKSIEKFTANGRILRVIAHEVRNPLTNITLATEQLSEEVPSNEETNLLLEMIKRNTNRINQLISELLNSTKFSPLELVKISVEVILDQALDQAKDRIELKGIQVIRNYSAKLNEVTVDVEKLKIAFLNLILNAIEAMESNRGKLEITTEQVRSKCLITIKDNGIGMSEEVIHRIFDPYFTQKEGGNGLGLTHTQNIILNHKGSINVESKLGEGTRFLIELGLV